MGDRFGFWFAVGFFALFILILLVNLTQLGSWLVNWPG